MLAGISIAVLYATFARGFIGNDAAFAASVNGLSLPAVSSAIAIPQQADPAVLRPAVTNKTLRTERPISASEGRVAEQFAALMASPAATTTAPAQEDAVVRAAAVVETPVLPPYQVYVVREGDTVSSIAARFGVSVEYIVANNPEIENSDFLHLGQSIIVPSHDGILHEVRYGETLSDIAARYSVDVEEISAFAGNNIATADDIREQQLVFVPNGKPLPAATPVAEPDPDPTEPPPAAAPRGPNTPVPVDNSSPPSSPPQVVSGPPSSTGLIWPVYGPISSYYGGRHPLGIDIDGFNLAGAAIVASTSGTVIFAGGNACCSYGLYVVVMSPSGIETLYAHLSSISVVAGQTVSQGQVLGIIGSTGYSTGRHLHFEVIDNGVRQNPLSYLP